MSNACTQSFRTERHFGAGWPPYKINQKKASVKPNCGRQWIVSEEAGLGEDADRTGTELLLTDLDLGLTFMDVADTTGIQENVLRNHRNARRAYDAVLVLLAKLRLRRADRQAVEAKLALLRARLEGAGYQF
jgi:hypothetical protein